MTSFLKKYILLPTSLILLAAMFVLSANADPEAPESGQQAPNWLEPRPLSVVDLISGGLDPSLMAGSPLVYQPGQATVQYVSGSKNGKNVTVTARMLPVERPFAYCLGQDGIRDQWPTVVPESRIRIRSNGVDITDKLFNIQYFPVGHIQPNRGSSDGPARYQEIVMVGDQIQFDSQGRLIMPANMGCKMFFRDGASDGGNLEMTFEHTMTQHISVSVVDTFSHDFKNYYQNFPGNFGAIGPFNDQMVDVKGGGTAGRHDLIKTVPPEEANYTLWVYEPTKLDMYATRADLQAIKPFPGSGTYRFRNNDVSRDLSVDWISMAGIPIDLHAVDRDFSGDSKYLKLFKADQYKFMGFEVLALDSEYNDCMSDGNCSTAFVEEVGGKRKPTTFYYLKVTRIAPGLTQIPLCAVGAGWSPSDAGTMCDSSRSAGIDTAEPTALVAAPEIGPEMDSIVFLPAAMRPVEVEVDNPNANCPCGWFTEDGRMLEYVLPPNW